jgi:serine/threonine-protein kinase
VAVDDSTTSLDRRCRHCGTAVPPGFAFCSKCGATVESRDTGDDPLAERLSALFGRELELERLLGRGGMAAVYSAFDPALQRRVAVKVLLPEIAEDPEMVTRFLREGRTVAALQHPHVVAVYGVREGDGVSAIVMQFVEGRSLDVVVAEKGRLPLAAAGLVLSQVAAGLQHAHDRGIVHRDVKPANVLLDSAGSAIVSDFGIARRQGVTSITGEGMVFGTIAYMSPEQRRGEAIGPPADQYAFGVMAFEVLTGRLPFTGTVQEMMRGHLYDPPPALRPLRADVPVGVEALVLRMLEKDPAARPRDMAAAERAFGSLVPDERSTTTILAGLSQVEAKAGSEVRRAVTRPVTKRLDEPVPSTARASVPVPATGRPALLRWAGAVGALAAIVAFAWAWQSRRADTRGASPAPEAAAPTAAAPLQGAGAASHRTDTIPPGTAPSSALSPSSSSTRSQLSGAARGNDASPGARGANPAPPVSPGADPRSAVTARDSAPTRLAPPREATPLPVASQTESPPSASPATSSLGATATITDARAVAREFVTLLNKGQWREVEQLKAIEGDAAARAELVRLARTSAEFAAGFDRVASAPVAAGDAFLTEFVVDLEWKGGRKLVQVRVRAEKRDGAWRLAGFGALPAE